MQFALWVPLNERQASGTYGSVLPASIESLHLTLSFSVDCSHNGCAVAEGEGLGVGRKSEFPEEPLALPPLPPLLPPPPKAKASVELKAARTNRNSIFLNFPRNN